MIIEMEIPKIISLKNNMPRELFGRRKFYDLVDALTHLATGNETGSFITLFANRVMFP